MRPIRGLQGLTLLAAFLVVCLTLTSCTLFPQKAATTSDTVTDKGADLTVAGVHIVVPAGAAPAGTKIEASFEDHSPAGADGTNLTTLAKAFKIKLGNGLEPSKPLTVTIPVDKSLLLQQQSADTATTIAMMVQSEGATKPDLVKATWDPVAGTVTAQIPHLSWLWPVQLNLGALMKNVRDSIMQSLGIEYPKPDCADKPVTINGSVYKAISPAQAWLCVSETNGSLTVTASPNSPIPFMVASSPNATATNKVEISAETAFSVALAHTLGFTKDGTAIMMPGADAQFIFTGTPSEVKVGFSQYPAMLLVSILAKTLDVAIGKLGDAVQLDKITKAGCAQNILDTSMVGKILSPATASGIAKSFFGCAGTVLSLSLPAQIILAILSAGPQFLVASALGIINEFTGGADFTTTITATTPPLRSTMDGATRFITLDPWHDGSASAVSATYDASTAPADQVQYASCSGSEIAPRSDGFRCYWPGIFDPCFQSQPGSGNMLCVTSDQNGKQEITLLKNMRIGSDMGSFINPGTPDQSSPVSIVLTDGTVCSRSTGAGPKGVPGYPYWAGYCVGPNSGVWRVGEADQWKNDLVHYTLYPAVTPGGYWQAAISVGSETAPATRFDVKTVYR